MISERDLRARVAEWGLRDDVVEKDYVLGWVLAGIGSDPTLGTGWVFKGGTCLKKCYLETFRFSEDLDFTVLESAPIDESDVSDHLQQMLTRIGSESGIDFAVREPRLRVRPNGSLEGRIYYRGPRGAHQPASVRLDLTHGEQLARPPVLRPIQHLYPDALPEPGTALCYTLEEVYAEKIRAMGERGRPRDLYDIVFLLDHPDLAEHAAVVLETLEVKCASKGVPVPTFESLSSSPYRGELESEWANMLGHQLPALPPLGHFWNRLSDLFAWLGGVVEPTPPPTPVSRAQGETVWHPTAARWAWPATEPLEPIRFAGANRLCVDLGYQGSIRRIEPYSLRSTRDGNLLLYAIRRDNRQIRAYRVDRIQSVAVTNEPFQPIYAVEFRPSGQLVAPQATQRLPAGPARRRPGTSSAGRYTVRCPYCGKTFPRARRDPKLNTHKDNRTGRRCRGSGGRGRFE